MSKTITVDFVTPEKSVLKEEAEYVSLPAYDGSMGVLPGHIPLLAQLVPGAVRLKRNNHETTFAISGGFAEVGPHQVSIFAETAELAEEINLEEAIQEAEKAKVQLTGMRTSSEVDLLKVEAQLRVALARLKAAESARRHRPPVVPPH